MNLGKYTYPESGGKGVTAYVIDTGITITHKEFGERARWGKTVPQGEDALDVHGHGTHVAGTIGGSTYGIAKNVNLVAVKVLDSQGRGTNSDVIAGINFAVEDYKNLGANAKAVANMSLGGYYSYALNLAIDAAIDSGIQFSVAAGNEYSDACDGSPSSSSKAITVAAMDITDNIAEFSNTGSCVDVIAPGVDITSSWNVHDSATNVLSGTSMAAPHVTGALALFLADRPAFKSAAELKTALLESTISGAINQVPSNTPNKLLNTMSLFT